jgi:hypothetical protein
MSRQHLFHSCLGLALLVGCLSGCVPPLTPTSASTPPSHGNQYYSRQAAKFLGSDNVDAVNYRLIDSATFENILRTCNSLTSTRATRTLLDSSCLITVDSAQIQAELQLIRDSSLVFKVEYQMYIFINRNTGVISCVRDRPGNNTKSPIEVISSQYYGVTYPKVGNEPPDMRILIAQVHGHPAILDERRKTISSMSDTDQLASHCLQVPIYAVDAMDGEIGEPGHIHRANPDPGPNVSTQDLYIGETWGTKRANTGLTINLGLDALRIWGRSQAPDFKCIADWNKAILSKGSATHDLGVIRPLAP